MREHLEEHSSQTKRTRSMPKLYGISLIGTRMAFYSMEKSGQNRQGISLRPLRLRPSPNRFVDTAPELKWEWDIATDEGYDNSWRSLMM